MKFAFVAIVGRPSVGKSTLLNKMCGEKVAIVSKVPQTTRNAIRGIVNKELKDLRGQLVFIDTPGRHSSEKKINKKLIEVSNRALTECDLVLYVLDATRSPGSEEEEISALLAPLAEKVVVAVNKIDVSNSLDPFVSVTSFSKNNIFPVSAQTGEGMDELLLALLSLAPEGEALYGEDYYTDQDVGFRIAEIIREQAINRLRQELPHSLYVDIADIELKEKDNLLWVRAFIIVERESQKGMVVGKGGEMIKAIRLSALKELKLIFDWKIDLDLRVKTGKDWRSKDHVLKRIVG
ncbi:MAG: GTPase Era [Treponema sp.]|jgi:GTP-binding protein Era|nr:GTPase Era [Treponema sp.]